MKQLLTPTDRQTLAMLYCLYGHEPFLWHSRGRFQYWFGITRRTRNRLIKRGLLSRYYIQYKPHWLAFTEVCQLSERCQFDDERIQSAIDQQLASDPIQRQLSEQRKPYRINEPEVVSFVESAYLEEFVRLLEQLPTQSRYLLSLDPGRIRYRASYWPQCAVQTAQQTLSLHEAPHNPSKVLNQMATNAQPTEDDPALIRALTTVIDGLADPDNHYTVSANYYDHQSPERLGERWHIAQIWLNAETSSEAALTQQGLVCSVRLNRHNLNQISRILLPYEQIWSVQSAGNKPDQLYYCSDKLNLVTPDQASSPEI